MRVMTLEWGPWTFMYLELNLKFKYYYERFNPIYAIILESMVITMIIEFL